MAGGALGACGGVEDAGGGRYGLWAGELALVRLLSVPAWRETKLLVESTTCFAYLFAEPEDFWRQGQAPETSR